MGGDADAVLRRAARYASGWWPFLTRPEDLADRIDFIKSQPEFRGDPFEVMYGMSTARVGEGHTVRAAPESRPGLGTQEIIDRLSWLAGQGVTMSSVPIPPMRGIAEYLDYAQWIMEEIRPAVA
jgi:hypothetical protein